MEKVEEKVATIEKSAKAQLFNFDLSRIEPKWYKWQPMGVEEDSLAELEIRPYPASRAELKMRRKPGEDQSLDFIMAKKDERDMFIYCLTNARGFRVNGRNVGSELRLDDRLKGQIYDYFQDSGIVAFVLDKAGIIRAIEEREEKN